MFVSTTALLSSAIAVTLVAAQSPRVCDADIVPLENDHFEFPQTACAPGNYEGINVYPLGTAMTIRWLTTYDPVNLVIVQEDVYLNGGSGQSALSTLLTNTSEKEYAFNGYPPQPLSNSPTFFFGIYADGTAVFLSDYINFTDPNAVSSSALTSSSTTSSLASSAVAETSTQVPSTNTAAAATSTATSPLSSDASPDKNEPGSGNASRNIGLGVGIGVGVTLLAALAAWFLYRRRQHKKAVDQLTTPHAGPYGGAEKFDRSYPQAYPSGYQSPQEMQGHSKAFHAPRSELPS